MAVKIDIFSGFLGAGKTTLMKKLLEEAFIGEKVALIENEFGTVGIDGKLMKNYDLQITELNAGCICCSIAGDFTQGLREVLKLYNPDRILIEPSGVSKLSDVIKGCTSFLREGLVYLELCITVVDATKYKMYLKNFSEFYKDQLKNAKTIMLSRTAGADRGKLDSIVEDIRQYNGQAAIITTDWDSLDGKAILHIAKEESRGSMEESLQKGRHISVLRTQKVTGIRIEKEVHSAEEVFSVWGIETAKIFSSEKLKDILHRLDSLDMQILRGKGILEGENHEWLQFDYVPGEVTINKWTPDYTGRICIIGSFIDKDKLKRLFEV
ncbi:CobW family GTP-binding protein [Anaerocolumna xylanovorans]|uniref:GTPase, G3E family n=1 Tax=Anaerocolumna xylanovorans DSM 12503 TaxID=1121345 RepID=A0A1M7YJB8_9FIRM|nr:GTP-binding protein [Anaerocolumna xylanovorans]SHO52703.1 GTPase, G3E family [Anaerocolumna xylanovorans DSM 12503]